MESKGQGFRGLGFRAEGLGCLGFRRQGLRFIGGKRLLWLMPAIRHDLNVLEYQHFPSMGYIHLYAYTISLNPGV